YNYVGAIIVLFEGDLEEAKRLGLLGIGDDLDTALGLYNEIAAKNWFNLHVLHNFQKNVHHLDFRIILELGLIVIRITIAQYSGFYEVKECESKFGLLTAWKIYKLFFWNIGLRLNTIWVFNILNGLKLINVDVILGRYFMEIIQPYTRTT
ncbi:hypothetical protein ACJX0J_017920, partial [Zea mays]